MDVPDGRKGIWLQGWAGAPPLRGQLKGGWRPRAALGSCG